MKRIDAFTKPLLEDIEICYGKNMEITIFKEKVSCHVRFSNAEENIERYIVPKLKVLNEGKVYLSLISTFNIFRILRLLC